MQSRNAAINADFKALYARCCFHISAEPQLCPHSCQHPHKITRLPFGRQKVKFCRVLKLLYVAMFLFREIGALRPPSGADNDWRSLVQNITQIWFSSKPLFNALWRKASRFDICGILKLLREHRKALHRHDK